jgi:hypothetical protein
MGAVHLPLPRVHIARRFRVHARAEVLPAFAAPDVGRVLQCELWQGFQGEVQKAQAHDCCLLSTFVHALH